MHILLADDDDDDCLLFQDVLKELSLSTKLATAKNGYELMQMLKKKPLCLPDVVFLDLNMPLKNGVDCLKEIKQDSVLNHLPVVIFSTSAQPNSIDLLYEEGANLYIRKPNSFLQLRDIIQRILIIDWNNNASRLSRKDYFWDSN